MLRGSVRVLRESWVAQTLLACLVFGIAIAVLSTVTRAPVSPDHADHARAAASVAVDALEDRDLVAVTKVLAANRGHERFAYYFASSITPSALGEVLTQRDDVDGATDTEDLDREVLLTDVAGALALATHTGGPRELPSEWSSRYIEATLSTPDGDEHVRATLLRLLARGHWSVSFLQQVTRAYWSDDIRRTAIPFGKRRAAGPDASEARTHEGDEFAALMAALSSNPIASEWAFSEFLPGTTRVDGSKHELGRFTHYLLFERDLPLGPEGEPIGQTATLTALASAAEMETQFGRAAQSGPGEGRSSPSHDVAVLQSMSEHVSSASQCSWHPRHLWACAAGLAREVWTVVRRWGRPVLGVLSLASLAPPPFSLVGAAAAGAGATWAAIEGDYAQAGLSLAAVVPGLASTRAPRLSPRLRRTSAPKVLKRGTATGTGIVAKARNSRVTRAARAWRVKPWKNCELAQRAGGLALRYKSGWGGKQRRAATKKVRALNAAALKGELRKTIPIRSGSLRERYRRMTGTNPPPGMDVDHVIELQLGGADELSNLQLLDRSVNRSIGKSIANQLGPRHVGARVTRVAICDARMQRLAKQ